MGASIGREGEEKVGKTQHGRAGEGLVVRERSIHQGLRRLGQGGEKRGRR